MRTLALVIVGGAIVVLVLLGQSHEDGLSGVWADFTGDDDPPIAKIEVDITIDISTP